MLSNFVIALASYALLLAFPAYKSFKALNGPSYDYKYNLLKYWVVVACYFTLEYPIDLLLGWFPLYTLFKLGGICALSLTNLSLTLFNELLNPIFQIYEASIDQLLEKNRKEALSTIGSKFMVSSKTALAIFLRFARLSKAEQTVIIEGDKPRVEASVIASMGEFVLVRADTVTLPAEPIQFPTDLKLPMPHEVNPYDPPLPRIPRRKSSPMKRAPSYDENGNSTSFSHSAAEEIRSKILFQTDMMPHQDFKKPKKATSKKDKVKDKKEKREGKEKKKEKLSRRRSSLPDDLPLANEKRVQLGEVTNVIGSSSASSEQENSHSSLASSASTSFIGLRARNSGHLRDLPDPALKGTPLKKTGSLKARF